MYLFYIKKKKEKAIDLIKKTNIVALHNVNENNSLELIYQGYMASIQITENGVYMRINGINKIISGKKALFKILELIGDDKGLS